MCNWCLLCKYYENTVAACHLNKPRTPMNDSADEPTFWFWIIQKKLSLKICFKGNSRQLGYKSHFEFVQMCLTAWKCNSRQSVMDTFRLNNKLRCWLHDLCTTLKKKKKPGGCRFNWGRPNRSWGPEQDLIWRAPWCCQYYFQCLIIYTPTAAGID